MARLENWEVAVARNGQEALRRWGEQRHDVLLLDLMLPGALDREAQGIETGQFVRALIVAGVVWEPSSFYQPGAPSPSGAGGSSGWS